MFLNGVKEQVLPVERCGNLFFFGQMRKMYYFMSLYPEVPMNTIPMIPKGMGHIWNSSSPVNINITAITTMTIPIQNLNLLGFLVSCFIFIFFLSEFV